MWSLASPGLVFRGLPAGTVTAIGVVAALALIGLYLLRLRRRRVYVAFSPLWTAALGERRHQRWARRLRRWVSLLLALVFLALLLLAAADPQPDGAERAGRSVVILVDRSASMSARDEPQTRLGAARAAADQLIAELGSRDRAMVVGFAAGVTAESAFEADASRLRGALAALTPSEEPGDLRRALSFAAAVLHDRPHPTLILVTDGLFPPDDRRQVAWAPASDAVSLAGIDARVILVGKRADNVALLSFAARRMPADPASVEAALVIQNFGEQPVSALVEITAGRTRQAVERFRVDLGAGERRRHVLSDVAAVDPELEARLLPVGGKEDALRDQLALDDRAYAVIPGFTRWKVLRVGDANLFLDGALLSLGDAVEIKRLPRAAAEESRPTWGDYDVVIFDGIAPAPAPVSGRFLYLDPQGAGSPFPTRGTMAAPVISDVKRGHPLLRQLSLADVNIAEARRLALEAGDVAVASALGAPLIAARARAALRVVAVAFDVRRSDLPMRSAFPLLLANALGFLAASESMDAPSLKTGRTGRIVVASADGPVRITDPGGRVSVAAPLGDLVELPVTRAGFYRLAHGPDGTVTPRALSANLSDAVESNIAPARELTLGERTLPPPAPLRRRRQLDVWAWALIAAATLSLLEWVSYHRRWTI